MKKLLLCIACILICFTSIDAQSFNLHPSGFRDSIKVDNNYLVFNFTGKKQRDLYNDFFVKINSTFNSDEDRIKSIDGHSIIVSSSADKVITFQKIYKYGLKCDIKYTITFLFKEGKVRVNAPSVDEISGEVGKLDLGAFGKITGKGEMHLTEEKLWMGEKAIFGKDGEIKEEQAKQDLETLFNKNISSIVNSVKKYQKEVW